jgi:hypothetical protein
VRVDGSENVWPRACEIDFTCKSRANWQHTPAARPSRVHPIPNANLGGRIDGQFYKTIGAAALCFGRLLDAAYEKMTV